MKWYGKEITCTRGETWAFRCNVTDRDGTPFRIANLHTQDESSNDVYIPHSLQLLITVASMRYDKPDRYVLNYWISLENFPVFNSTEVEKLNKTLSQLQPSDWHDKLIYSIPDNEYYYYAIIETTPSIVGQFKKYSFCINNTFLSAITKDWVEHTYLFSIKLVNGTPKVNPKDDEPPFSKITEQYIILPETKLIVQNNLNGGI